MLSGSRDGDWELLAVRTKSSAMSLEITVAAGGQQGGKEDTHLRDRSKEPSRRETHAHRLSGRKACVRLHMWRFLALFFSSGAQEDDGTSSVDLKDTSDSNETWLM